MLLTDTVAFSKNTALPDRGEVVFFLRIGFWLTFLCLAIGCQPGGVSPSTHEKISTESQTSGSSHTQSSSQRQDRVPGSFPVESRDRQTCLDDLNRVLRLSNANDPDTDNPDTDNDQVLLPILKECLVRFPDDPIILFTAATAQHRLGMIDDAIQTLRQIDLSEPEVGPAALGLRSDWLSQSGRHKEAIVGYQNLLEHFPDSVAAHRQLAALLNDLGRRHEAAQHLRDLVRIGDVRQSELASLLSIQDPSSTSVVEHIPDLLKEPLRTNGPIASARNEIASHTPQLAIDSLTQMIKTAGSTVRSDSGWDAALALLGRAATDANDMKASHLWWNHLDQDQIPLSDHWFALSELANEHLRDTDLAVKLMVEAILRDPTDRVAHGLLANWINATHRRSQLTIDRIVLPTDPQQRPDHLLVVFEKLRPFFLARVDEVQSHRAPNISSTLENVRKK